MWEIQREVAMDFTPAGILAGIACIALTACPLVAAQCPIHSILIKGRVEHPPPNASVRVLLLYPPERHRKNLPGTDSQNESNERPGESAEAILDGDGFTIPVEFLTNDSRTEMTFQSRCGRQPLRVVVTLKRSDDPEGNEREYDRVSLDFPRQFKSGDSSHYLLRSALVLNPQQP
jgi:hypothetical protein